MINKNKLIHEIFKIQKEINKIDFENATIVLYGAGNVGKFVNDEFVNNKNVLFCDSNPNKIGKQIAGRRVVSIDEIKNISNAVILISTMAMFQQDIRAILRLVDLPVFSYYSYFFAKYELKFKEVYQLLEDEESKLVFLTLIYERMVGEQFLTPDIYNQNQYFALPEFRDRDPDCAPNFIDCGAYCGENIESFLVEHGGRVRKIIAFEPGLKQFKALKARLNRLISEWALDDNAFLLNNSSVSNSSDSFFISTEEADAGTGLTLTNTPPPYLW